jgi:hypothetical protein
MPLLKFPQTFLPRVKPALPKINRLNPIGALVTHAVDPSLSLDLVRQVGLVTNDVGTGVSLIADYLHTDDGGYREYDGLGDWQSTSYTLLMHLRVNASNDSYGNIMGKMWGGSASQQQISIFENFTSGNLALSHGNLDLELGTKTIAALGGDFHRLALKWDGSNMVSWLDSPDSRESDSFSDSITAGSDDLILGAGQDRSTSVDTDSDFKHLYFFKDIELTDAMIESWLNDPYQVIQRPPVFYFVPGGADVTPPTLSSPTGTATGSTTADGTVSTNEGNGTLYWVVTQSATAPSVAQVQAGQDHTGSPADDDGSQAVSATGTQNVNATGLTAETTYYFHYQQEDAATNDSTVVSSASFTTSAAGATLSSPTGTVISDTIADGSVSTDTGSGTLHFYASTNSTETAATIKANGKVQAVTASGTQNIEYNDGLVPGASYYLHYVQVDGGVDSNVVSSAQFTMQAAQTYTQFIADLGTDHHWDFDGNSTDNIGSANGTDTSVIYTDSAITEDATNCMTTNAIAGDRVTLPTTTTINNSAQQRKAMFGSIEITEFSPHPVRIYGEGTEATCWQLCMGYGNQLIFEVTEPVNFATGLQVYGIPAVPNRVYHLFAKFLGNTQGNQVQFYVDGIEQTAADPSDRQPDTADLNTRGVGEFGDPVGTTGLGGAVVLQQAGTNMRYQHWGAWGDEADADLSAERIRLLFERSALADFSVATAAESAMQTSLDAITDSQGNAPVCIEIDAVTGGGDFTLTSDKTFDPLASVHFRYNGTDDTLTIVNVSGGDASIGSAPFGGNIVIATRQTLTVTARDIITSAAIEGARVRIVAAAGGDLPVGTVIMNELTNSSGVATTTFDYTNTQPITGTVRKGSELPVYKTGLVGGPITDTPLNETVLLSSD